MLVDWREDLMNETKSLCASRDVLLAAGAILRREAEKDVSRSRNDRAELRIAAAVCEGVAARESLEIPHLRGDAPFLVCTDCLRKSWCSKAGDGCGMLQPDGSHCLGTFA